MTPPTHLISSVALLKCIEQLPFDNLQNKITASTYVIFALGSIFPDITELFLARFSWKRYFKIHRTYLHWWILYVILFIIHLVFYYFNFYNYNMIHIPYSNIYLNSTVFLILSGSLLHLFEDYFSLTGIPYLRPKGQKMKKTIYSTGSVTEFLLFAFFLIIVLVKI